MRVEKTGFALTVESTRLVQVLADLSLNNAVVASALVNVRAVARGASVAPRA